MTLSLHELTQKIGDEPDLQHLMDMSDEYSDYVELIDNCAIEVLKDLSAEDARTAITVIKSIVIADIIQGGDISIKDLNFLMSNGFDRVALLIFKLSVGIAVAEELR